MNREEIEKAFTPPDKCSICDSEYDPEEGGVQGHFGMMPVTFCVWCYSSMLDMAEQDLNMHNMEDEE